MQVRDFLDPVTLLAECHTLADAEAPLARREPVFLRNSEAWWWLSAQAVVGLPLSRRLIDVPLARVYPIQASTDLRTFESFTWPATPVPVEDGGSIVGHLRPERLLSAFSRETDPDELSERLLARLLRPLVHDLGNSLFVASVSLDAALDDLDKYSLNASRLSIRHATSVVQRISEVCAGQVAGPPGPLNVNALLLDLKNVLDMIAGRAMKIELVLEPELPTVRCYRRVVERVMLNLVLNACEAMEHRGAILVSTREVLRDAQRCICLAIEDDGPGLGREDSHRPRRRSSSEPWRGVGLRAASDALSRVGARLAVCPSQLGGAGFEILLPIE